MENQTTNKVPNGKVCYMLMPTRDIVESAKFYQAVFGWNIRTRSDGSTAFDDAINGVSGTWVMDRKPHKESGLLIYIMVDDVAATAEVIIAHGGKIVEPISGKESIFVATFSDPSGNVFGIGQE
jgi:predicted enzyme related to lactoylglutathione lyase